MDIKSQIISMSKWEWKTIGKAVQVLDNLRKPINSAERQNRVAGKNQKELYPYYGATGQVGWIDSYITNGEYILVGEDGAPFMDIYKEKAYRISGKTWVNNHAHILQEIEGITINSFILHYLNSINYRQYVNGTTRLKLTKGSLVDIPFPTPSIEIQKNIVSKIEELFSELDKGIENLKTAQQQLKTYRQSVLKWAFEGKLTNKNVKEGELPEGWEMKKLKSIAKEISDGDHQAPPKSTSGIPFITISNVNKDTSKIDFSKTFMVPDDYYNKLKENRKPIIGDVLYTVTGSFGIPILIDFDRKFCFQRHIGLIRPLETTNQKWLYYLLQSPGVFNQAKETATGTAQKTVALNSLRNFEVVYCQPSEQSEIVQEIESRLSVADKMEESITQSLQQAEALRQSILKKAFEGRLV